MKYCKGYPHRFEDLPWLYGATSRWVDARISCDDNETPWPHRYGVWEKNPCDSMRWGPRHLWRWRGLRSRTCHGYPLKNADILAEDFRFDARTKCLPTMAERFLGLWK